MRIVFSAIKKKEQLDWVINEGARSFLFSFEDKKVINQFKHLAENYSHLPLFIFLDSGAFSTFNRGLKVDIDEYAEYIGKIKQIIPANFEFYAFNLDVIPHKKGTKPTLSQLNDAAKKGIENWYHIKSKGHSTIHTYHMYEDISIFKTILKECNDYELVGISPANDASLNARNEWLKTVFAEVKNKTRTHCLGLTAKESLEEFPCYSADSSTHLNTARFGELFIYDKLEKWPKKDMNKENIFYYDFEGKGKTAFKYFLHLEKYITELWEGKGIKFN